MKKEFKYLIGAAGFLLAIAGCVLLYRQLQSSVSPDSALQPQAPASSTSSTGDTSSESSEQMPDAMDFTAYTADGQEVQLSDFFGKPIVLNFWASWCGPCQMEMPHFQLLYDEFGDEISFLMVNMTGGRETVSSAQELLSDGGYTFPVYYDLDEDAAYTYYVTSLPTTYFINTEGKMVAVARSTLDEETLRRGIDMIYTAQPASSAESIPVENPSWCDIDPEYMKISAEEAKNIMEQSESYILLDVRTQEEYSAGHIEGAKLIPYDELSDRAAQELPDQRATILVYCRTGRRSEEAARVLVEMGYNHVYDFGGIEDWPYDTTNAQ